MEASKSASACEDLARAVDVICSMAGEMGIDTSCYSLWGGSAGARMAAWVGGYGVPYFGGVTTQKVGTVVMQYTGLSDYSAHDAPTYANCGTSDGIASWQTMQNRLNGMAALGIPTEFHAYQGLPHGFGLGTGTVAEGWIDDAVRFWEAQMPQGTTATEHVHAAGPNATAYDLQGRPVREGYRGIIIQNGNKYISL